MKLVGILWHVILKNIYILGTTRRLITILFWHTVRIALYSSKC